MKIEDIKEQYKDEWVLVEVLKEDKLNKPKDVKLIMHSKNRDDIYDKLESIESGRHIATFYTGEIPEKGYAVAFYGCSPVDGLLGLSFLKNFNLSLNFREGIL